MRPLWSAAAGFCFVGLAGCVHTQADYAESAAQSWLHIVTSEPAPQAKYAMMCNAYRQSVPLEAFEAALAHNAYLNGATDLQVLGSDGNASLSVHGAVWTSKGKYDLHIYEGVEDGRMCITGLSIGGTPMLPPLAAASAAGSAPTSVESAGVSAR